MRKQKRAATVPSNKNAELVAKLQVQKDAILKNYAETVQVKQTENERRIAERNLLILANERKVNENLKAITETKANKAKKIADIQRARADGLEREIVAYNLEQRKDPSGVGYLDIAFTPFLETLKGQERKNYYNNFYLQKDLEAANAIQIPAPYTPDHLPELVLEPIPEFSETDKSGIDRISSLIADVKAIRSYNLYKADAADGVFTKIAENISKPYAFTNTAKSDVWYKVSAVNKYGESGLSNSVKVDGTLKDTVYNIVAGVAQTIAVPDGYNYAVFDIALPSGGSGGTNYDGSEIAGGGGGCSQDGFDGGDEEAGEGGGGGTLKGTVTVGGSDTLMYNFGKGGDGGDNGGGGSPTGGLGVSESYVRMNGANLFTASRGGDGENSNYPFKGGKKSSIFIAQNSGLTHSTVIVNTGGEGGVAMNMPGQPGKDSSGTITLKRSIS